MSQGEDRGADAPSDKTVAKALSRLCRYGVEIFWVREEAGVLFDLSCVNERAINDFKGDDDACSLALIEILRERVKLIENTQHGKILSIVLAFDEKYRGMTAKERCTIAGELFRDGKRQVTYGTIRQHHLPKALMRLATLLLALEQESQAV